MQSVRVTLDAGGREGDIHPMYDILANADFVDRATALQWSFTAEAQALLHYIEGDVEAFRSATADIPEVIDTEMVPAGEEAFYTVVKGEMTEGMADLFDAIIDVTAIPVPPIEYHPDGTVSFTLVGPADEIQTAIERVPEPVQVSIEEVGGMMAVPGLAETLLSTRQRETLDAALELGYYDIPREASHEDVADAVGCAPSTAAEHLRKAESKVLDAVGTR